METNALCRQLVRSYVSANSLESRIVVLDRRVGELTSEDLNHDEVTTTHTAVTVNHCHSYHIISYITDVLCGCGQACIMCGQHTHKWFMSSSVP